MTGLSDLSHASAKRFADRLNIFPIGLFCLWLGPCVLFWAKALGPMRSFDTPAPQLAALPWLIASLLSGALVLALPSGYYRIRAFERSGRLHEAMGARFVRGFVTNGDHINRAVSRRYPNYRVHQYRDRIAAAQKTTFSSEKSHLVCFVAGISPSIYAVALGWWDWALWLTVTNILGNFYPALVQRHTRARLASLAARRSAACNR